MLLLGRHPGISDRIVICSGCGCEIPGSGLSAKLVWIEWMRGYLCVYCCPVCASTGLGYKGKVLPFTPRQGADHKDLGR